MTKSNSCENVLMCAGLLYLISANMFALLLSNCLGYVWRERERERERECVHVRVCVCTYMPVCVCVRVCVRVHALAAVFHYCLRLCIMLFSL